MTLSELLAERRGAPAPAPAKPTTSLSVRLGYTDRAIPEDEVLGLTSKAPVQSTDELLRIQALPRRPRPTDAELDALVDKWNERLMLRRGPCDCAERFAHLAVPCICSLNQLQAWGCEEFSTEGGLLGKLPVGSGKTGLDILLPMARDDVHNALLLLQSSLMVQFLRDDYPQWAAHFRVPNLALHGDVVVPGRPTLHVYSYSDLSNKKHTNLLSELDPDLIIADEAQNLANVKSSRTIRFIRHFQNRPQCKYGPLSGSLNTRTIVDLGHHAALALRERSPVPISMDTRKKWGKALDPAPANGIVVPIGALRVLCEPGETAVEGVGRRILDTRGVVSGDVGSCKVPLDIYERTPPPIPEVLAQAMAVTRTGQRPDGEEAESAFQKAAWLKQIACGFYYRFKFPHNEPVPLIEEWFACRKAWRKEVREKLEGAAEFEDSPHLLENAAKRYYAHYRGELPVWAAKNYQEWSRLRPLVQPVQDVVWIDDHLLNDAVAWAQGGPGVLWCEYSEIGYRISDALGLNYYNGGRSNKELLRQERGDRVVVASIPAYHRGMNMQQFSRALVTSNPADGGTWEQLLGRLHRFGQTRPVRFDLYLHTPELRAAFDKALDRSEWVAKLDRCEQKLVTATKHERSRT